MVRREVAIAAPPFRSLVQHQVAVSMIGVHDHIGVSLIGATQSRTASSDTSCSQRSAAVLNDVPNACTKC